MANRRVSIYQSAKVGGVWSYFKPVFAPNNKIKPDWCHVNGHQEHHPGSDYLIKWYEGRKQRILKCKNAADAQNQAAIQRSILHAKTLGIPVKELEAPSLLLSAAVYAYLEEYRLTHSDNSYAKVKQVLEEFRDQCKRTDLKDVTRLDILKYGEWLQRKRKLSARTAADKFLTVHSFLKSKGIKLVTGRDAPKYTESMPEVYTSEELTAFFAACGPYERTLFSVFLKAGLREKELIHLQWDDLNFKEGTLHVSAKPEYGWMPKTHEERTIPIPDDLAKDLGQALHLGKLVFPTKKGQPNTKLLRLCKGIAKRAGLDEAGFFLHKFRATFATRCLQAGMDLRTVQYMLGHKDIDSTMRYLAPATNASIKEQLNEVWKKKSSSLFQIGTGSTTPAMLTFSVEK
jgi:integrase